MRPLPRTFYMRPTRTVARDLLGRYLVRSYRGAVLIGKIVEVEAYLGELDPASHAYCGRTERNSVMFGEGGHLYVYFTYGMHFCANIVTGHSGAGRAVLIRAVEPVAGVRSMKERRKASASVQELTNGPAKLCQAFGIGRGENGIDLMGKKIFVARGEPMLRSEIAATTRIGISRGKELKWRYLVKGNPFVSRSRPRVPPGETAR